MNAKKIWNRLHSLVIFRNLLEDPTISLFSNLLEALETENTEKCVSCYCSFTASLYRSGANFGDYVLERILDDENFYIQKYANGGTIDSLLSECLHSELNILQRISAITSDEIKEKISYNEFLPSWHTAMPQDFTKIYTGYLEGLSTEGYGLFRKYHVFTLNRHKLFPVRHPDTISMDQLFAYEYERNCIFKNTIALLEGKPAANVLLYGDSGTGKSSTVKAVANALAPRGLRLVEVKKNQLREIPDLVEMLDSSPLRFILFIDDLSFTRDDDDFSALKAILEGSVAARSGNIAVYATSNRRHLVRETFSDRDGDEIHANDTVQQLTSLSDRFGLTLTFSRPDKQQYLNIVRRLADLYGITMQEDVLFRRAEVFALERGGRSPRTAKQFLEQLQSDMT